MFLHLVWPMHTGFLKPTAPCGQTLGLHSRLAHRLVRSNGQHFARVNRFPLAYHNFTGPFPDTFKCTDSYHCVTITHSIQCSEVSCRLAAQVGSRLCRSGLCKFTQWQNRLMMHFSGWIPVFKGCTIVRFSPNYINIWHSWYWLPHLRFLGKSPVYGHQEDMHTRELRVIYLLFFILEEASVIQEGSVTLRSLSALHLH